jgi:hypothetical protein
MHQPVNVEAEVDDEGRYSLGVYAADGTLVVLIDFDQRQVHATWAICDGAKIIAKGECEGPRHPTILRPEK